MCAMNPRLLRPLATGFNPRQIAGLAAWWDSTDNSTITTDTGVSAWRDKVNSYTLEQSTGSDQPTLSSINGKQAFDYDGSTQLLSSTDAGLVAEGTGASAVNPATIFYVAEFDVAGTAIPAAWSSNVNNNLVYSALHTMNTSVWRTFYRDDNYTAEITTSSTATYSTATPYIVATQTDSNIVGRVNGAQVVTASNGAANLALTPTQFAVGALLRATAALFVNGRIGDVLIYDRVLTLAETQKVEGFLAWKYGLQGSLPTNHPYAYAFPGFGSQPRPSNSEALDWISGVIAAGSSVNTATANAVDAFVSGCKADGIWDAIKACCILCGPETLAGALVPLVGAAPTNNNFVAGDYNRLTGLVGDGSTTYLDSNRANDDDPQDDKHISVYRSVAATNNAGLIGSNGTTTGHSHIYTGFNSFFIRLNAATAADQPLSSNTGAAFLGASRAESGSFSYRIGGTGYTASVTSQTPASNNIRVFETNGKTNARLAFYSIGESLDLSLLQGRVDSLIAAIGAS